LLIDYDVSEGALSKPYKQAQPAWL
jgi:hypothetical protein